MDKGEGKGSFFWVEEPNEQTPIPVKHKRKVKAKKVEFVGWGSKSLIDFLESIGKDTSKKLSQYDVTAIIQEYVHKCELLHPLKKKKVVCDERLHALFGKKTVPRIKIYDLLESHFAENHDSSEDDLLYDSEEYEDANITCKKQKVSSSEKKVPSQKKKAPEAPSSRFAAVIPENIKLIYLKRSLVQELVKNPEGFEGKLLGSYIRVKSDPNDYTQKNSHQLLPVTGVKNVPVNGEVREEILLEVPNMIKDIPIRLLSDDDFSKEECEDLCQKVKDGLLKRPTVVEVEQKAQLLHEDITKHWLPRELAYLQNLIDRANEKSWRKELHEYLERRKLLQTPSEVSKLLAEVPKVTADKLDPEEEPVQHPSSEPILIPTDEGVGVVGVNGEAMENESAQVNGEAVGSEPAQNLRSFEWVESGKKQISNSLDLNNVIELSDDEETPNVPKDKDKDREEDEDELLCPKWFYLDPQGRIQGPVSLRDLKVWSDAGYFAPHFKIWKDGKTPESAILLTDVLSGKT